LFCVAIRGAYGSGLLGDTLWGAVWDQYHGTRDIVDVKYRISAGVREIQDPVVVAFGAPDDDLVCTVDAEVTAVFEEFKIPVRITVLMIKEVP
jgi:hypothetical protein